MPPPTIGGGGILLSGCLSVRPYVDSISRDAISFYLNGGISLKLATDIHQVSGYCRKRYQGQRSKVKVKVKVMTRPIKL